MHRADQRHGLTSSELRAAGHNDPMSLVGQAHDSAKGNVGCGIAWAGRWPTTTAAACGGRCSACRVPRAFDNLDNHAERSAALAQAAGCSERCAELIRHQADPADDALGVALRLADEAS